MLRIKEAREARGWSQERLAEEVSTTQQTIQRWESGRTDVRASQIKEISKALGVTVSYLLGVDSENGSEKPLSPDERELLDCFRQAGDWDRELILSHAKMVLAHAKPSKSVEGAERRAV